MEREVIWRTALLAALTLALSLPTWAAKKPVVFAPWAFHCTTEREHLPQMSTDVEAVFQRGLYLLKQRSQTTLKASQMAEFNEVARYLRVAHAHGHPKAGWYLMDWLYMLVDTSYDGVATSLRVNREEEVERVMAQMVDRRLPDGHLRRAGFAEQSSELQLAVDELRAAAELGSPDAQNKLAEWLDGESIMAGVVGLARPGTQSLAMDLYRCAAQQGHAPSITVLAQKLMRQGVFEEGVPLMQRAVAAGSAEAAYGMMKVFSGEPHGRWPRRKPAARVDAMRVARYDQIRMYLIGHASDQGVLPDLDRITPLPPAPLPKWSGTFQWDTEPRPAPERPSETLMARLCRSKQLDLVTGLPLMRP